VTASASHAHLDTTMRTTRLDEAVAAGEAAYFPHRLTTLGPANAFEMCLTARRLGSVTVGVVSYGVDVTLSCGELATGYQVNVPLSGRVLARNGTRDVVVRPGQAGIYLPTGVTTVDLITGDCLLLGIRIERSHLEEELERLLDRPLRRPAQLATTVGVTRGPGRDWLELVQTVRPHPARPNDLLAQPSIADQLGSALTTGLLLAASHDYAQEVDRPRASAGPGHVRRALTTIEQHYAEPLTITDLATAGRISVRRLQAGFRSHLGVTPMNYLRQFRIDRAHEQLRRAEPGSTSVTEVALTCGLRHLGRFATEYHDRYGETPSQTLHRPGGRAGR
jgi:AraC-like DNA-binding protein